MTADEAYDMLEDLQPGEKLQLPNGFSIRTNPSPRGSYRMFSPAGEEMDHVEAYRRRTIAEFLVVFPVDQVEKRSVNNDD